MADLIIRPSTKPIKVWYALAVLMAAAILWKSYQTENKPYALLAVPALIILWALAKHIGLRFTVLTLANGKLKFEQGMLSKSTRNLELSKIQDVRVDQSLMNRVFGLGNLTLETAGESGSLSMNSIDRPQEIADHILELARKKNEPAL